MGTHGSHRSTSPFAPGGSRNAKPLSRAKLRAISVGLLRAADRVGGAAGGAATRVIRDTGLRSPRTAAPTSAPTVSARPRATTPAHRLEDTGTPHGRETDHRNVEVFVKDGARAVALVTGSTSGIGAAVARRFAAEGM